MVFPFKEQGRVREEAWPLITTVDPADIRGLGTTLVVPSSACLGLESRVGLGRLVTPSRVAPYRDHAPSPTLPWCETIGSGGDDDVGMLAFGDEAAEALAQADLGLPGDVLDRLGEVLEALADVGRDLGGILVGPGAFDEGAAGVAIAGLGDGA